MPAAPSTCSAPPRRAAIQAIRNGTAPELAGANGTTNGAAMRIAPVGIATAVTDLDDLIGAVEEACLVSHHTSVAIAGAAAVAAVVSAGVDGFSVPVAVALGIAAARSGVHRAGGSRARTSRRGSPGPPSSPAGTTPPSPSIGWCR